MYTAASIHREPLSKLEIAPGTVMNLNTESFCHIHPGEIPVNWETLCRKNSPQPRQIILCELTASPAPSVHWRRGYVLNYFLFYFLSLAALRGRRPESIDCLSDRDIENKVNSLTIGQTGYSAKAIGGTRMSWTFKTTRSSAVSVSPASYLSLLQSPSEWTAAFVCPDNALQSSLMSS